MKQLSIAELWPALFQYSASNGRYKAFHIHSQSLQSFSELALKLIKAEPEARVFDGLKLLTTDEAFIFDSLVEAKYWLQDNLFTAPFTLVYRLDWLIGKWSAEEQLYWWDFVAKLETNAVILFCSTLKNSSENWIPLADLKLCRPVSLLKPKDSVLSL